MFINMSLKNLRDGRYRDGSVIVGVFYLTSLQNASASVALKELLVACPDLSNFLGLAKLMKHVCCTNTVYSYVYVVIVLIF